YTPPFMNGPLENGMDHRAQRGGRALRPLTAAAACVLALAGCGSDDDVPNVILPLIATATVTPDPGGDPQIYMQKLSETGDLVVVDIRLRTSAMPIQFVAFNLETTFDPSVVTIGDLSHAGGIFCDCAFNDPSCASAVDAICVQSGTTPTGSLVLGASACTGLGTLCTSTCTGTPCGAECTEATCSRPIFDTTGQSDVRLLTLGFRAVAETTGTTIEFPANPSIADGSCEILVDAGSGFTDLGIPCDLGLVLAAQR
ncbi:MAG: hypothetical protein ACRD6R_04610, partial [Candidatus Polarisedimenticolia bacterium]